MKNLVIFILSFFFYSSVFSQDMMEKRHFENHPELGGDVLIKSSSVKVEKDEIFKTFEIESSEEGAYYMAGFLAAPTQNDISLQKYERENARFGYPNFETQKLPTIKKTKSGQVRWEPDTVCIHWWHNNSWTNNLAYTYTYDSNNNLLTRTEQLWRNNSWEIGNYQNSYTYDLNNNMLTETELVWRDNSWVNFFSYSYTYTYDSNNNVLTKTKQSGSNHSGENIYSETYTYDFNNNMLTELWQIWENNSWVNYVQITYTYDFNNNLQTALQQTWENNLWSNYVQKTYTYDSNNNLQTELQQTWGNNSWSNYLLINYIYDSNNNVLSELRQTWENNSWVNSTQHLRIYDENGNGISAESWIWRNERWQPSSYGSVMIIAWLYYNNMQSFVEVASGDKLTASYTKVSDFTAIAELPATQGLNAISIYPNPTTGELKIKNEAFKIR